MRIYASFKYQKEIYDVKIDLHLIKKCGLEISKRKDVILGNKQTQLFNSQKLHIKNIDFDGLFLNLYYNSRLFFKLNCMLYNLLKHFKNTSKLKERGEEK